MGTSSVSGRPPRGSRRGKYARSSYLFWGWRSFWPQISAHTGTKTSINTTTTTNPGPAIDFTSPSSRRTGPPTSGESRRSTIAGSRTHHARHQSRCARGLGVLPLATRGASQRPPPPPPERNQRLPAGGVCRPERHPGSCLTAGGANEILGQRISDQRRRTHTGPLVDGPHSWPPVRSVPPGACPVDANPHCGEPLGGGQSVGEVVTG
jgi:hypothetical protein